MRVAAFNIRHGQGTGWIISTRRIALATRVIAADIVAMSEVFNWPGRYEQPRLIGAATDMHAHFRVNARSGPIHAGNALLTRGPSTFVRNIELPAGREPRGCLLVETDVDGVPALFGSTHLALSAKARAIQMEALAAELPADRPLVLMGDFNCGPAELEPLLARFHRPGDEPATYPAFWPRRSLDHILLSEHWRATDCGVVRTLASDHLPIWADIELV